MTIPSPTSSAPSLALVVALGAFSLLLALSVFIGLTSDSAAFLRTHATAWSMVVLATPPMTLYVLRYRRAALDGWWRWPWTFGWLMNLIHFYFGLFHLHDGDPLSVFQRQGFFLAFSIFFFTGFWGIDVAAAWLRPDWRTRYDWLNSAAWAVGFATFFISLVVFHNDQTSFHVGLVMCAAVGGGLAWRLWPRPAARAAR